MDCLLSPLLYVQVKRASNEVLCRYRLGVCSTLPLWYVFPDGFEVVTQAGVLALNVTEMRLF